MAQLDDLNTGLTAIAADVDATLAHVDDLQTQLDTIANTTHPDVDLTGPLATVAAIRAKLEGVSQAATDAAGGDQTAADPAA